MAILAPPQDRRAVMTGPGYDVIGDVHGHACALEALLAAMGYARTKLPAGDHSSMVKYRSSGIGELYRKTLPSVLHYARPGLAKPPWTPGNSCIVPHSGPAR